MVGPGSWQCHTPTNVFNHFFSSNIVSVLVVFGLLGAIGAAHAQTEPTAVPPVDIKRAELDDLQAELTVQPDAESICAKQATLKILRSGQLERE